MIDEVYQQNKEEKGVVKFKKINVIGDNQKIVIKDKENVMNIIQMKDIYPTVNMIEQIV